MKTFNTSYTNIDSNFYSNSTEYSMVESSESIIDSIYKLSKDMTLNARNRLIEIRRGLYVEIEDDTSSEIEVSIQYGEDDWKDYNIDKNDIINKCYDVVDGMVRFSSDDDEQEWFVEFDDVAVEEDAVLDYLIVSKKL